MKASLAITAIAALAVKASAACWSSSLGYPCCSSSSAEVWYTDNDGKWGVENGDWCGIPKESPSSATCWSLSQGYPCCKSTTQVAYTDDSGKWGVENGDWCGISSDSAGSSTGGSNEDINVTPGEQYTHNGNPFSGVEFFINPYYTAEVDAAIAQMSDSSLIAKAEKMKTYSNAIWLDTIKNMNEWLEKNLKGALAQQTGSKKVLTVFVVYDLPGRDCHALASNGELLANDGDLARYKSDYIDVIEGHLKTYKSQPVVLIVEPDSLANLVTNLESTPACRDSEKYYLDGHSYLIQKF
jgi:cellulose 1,4-beta-cellobiosidase